MCKRASLKNIGARESPASKGQPISLILFVNKIFKLLCPGFHQLPIFLGFRQFILFLEEVSQEDAMEKFLFIFPLDLPQLLSRFRSDDLLRAIYLCVHLHQNLGLFFQTRAYVGKVAL